MPATDLAPFVTVRRLSGDTDLEGLPDLGSLHLHQHNKTTLSANCSTGAIIEG